MKLARTTKALLLGITLSVTLSQAVDVLSKPATQTIPKAIPVIGQIPAARALVRDVIR